MRTVFVHSDCGYGLALARRLQADGVPVLLYIEQDAYREIGRGLVPRTNSRTPPRDALVLFDATGHGAYGDFLRKRGHPVIGGNRLETWERDRALGSEVARQAGIALPETHGFKRIDEAITFLEREDADQGWFVKFSGDNDTGLTAGAPDAEAMIRHLRWIKATHPGLRDPLELQRKVEGTEISTDAWFDGQRVVPPIDYTFEDKRAFTGDLGPNTDCSAEVVWLATQERPKLAEATILRLEEALRRRHYVGQLDVNAIVDAEGEPHFLEFTARAGWDSTIAWMHLFGDDLYDQLEAFAGGTLKRWQPTDPKALSMTLRFSVPPYPFEVTAATMKKAQGRPLDPAILKAELTTLADVRIGADGGPVLASGWGHVGTVGAVGDDPTAMRRQMVERVKGFRYPNFQMRVDPIKRAERDWARLDEHGLLQRPDLVRA